MFIAAKPISYCSTVNTGQCKAADTAETVREIRVHNSTLKALKKRWKVK